jgi:hypothetical protein
MNSSGSIANFPRCLIGCLACSEREGRGEIHKLVREMESPEFIFIGAIAQERRCGLQNRYLRKFAQYWLAPA